MNRTLRDGHRANSRRDRQSFVVAAKLFSPVLVIVSLALAAAAAHAAPTDTRLVEAQQLHNRGHEAYQRGDYPLALEYYGRALAIRLPALGPGHPDVAATCNNLGLVYSAQGDYARALEYYDTALAIKLAVLGPRDPEVATTYNNLAIVHYNQGEYPKAIDYFSRALAIRLAALGPRHPDVAATCNNLASVYCSQGEYDTALEYHGKSLEIKMESLGPRHPDVATTYNNLATVYCSQGDYATALEYFDRALEIRLAALDPRHPDLAQTYNNMAVVHNHQGEYASALAYYDKALENRLAALGPRHPEVAQTYHNMAIVHWNQGDYATALKQFGRALEIRLATLGPKHSDVAATYNGMAVVNCEQGEYARALEYCGQALAIKLAALGPRHPEVAVTYNNMALVYERQGNRAMALSYYAKALEIKLAALGPRHPDVARTYANLASVYNEQGEYARAREQYGQALEIRLAAFGPRHPEVAMTHHNLALVDWNQGDYDQALTEYGQALEIQLAALGPRHPDVAMTCNNMALAKCSQGDTPAGLRLFRQALDAVSTGAGNWDGTSRTLRVLPAAPQWLWSLSRAEASDTTRPERERLAAALRTATVGLDMLARLRGTLSQESRQFFEEKYGDLPGWVLHLQRELETRGVPAEPALTLRAAELASSVSFLEMMAAARVATAGALPERVAGEERALLARFKWLDEHVGDTRLATERLALEDTWTAFVDRLHRDYPRAAALKHPRPATLEAARGALAPDEVAVEYVVGGYGAFAVAVTPDSFDFVRLGGPGEIEAAAGAARAAMVAVAPGDRDPLAALYGRLLAPLASLIRGRRLLVVPSGCLEAVAFEALTLPDGRYLGEECAVAYAPSLAILALNREWRRDDPARGVRLLALGDAVYAAARPDAAARTRAAQYSDTERAGWAPLRGTGREVRGIAALFGDTEKLVLLKERATESNVTDADWREYGYLHFACHGALEEGPGRQPALVFSQTGNTPPADGFLTLAEVVARPHRARLTVLSACNSGRAGATLPKTGVSSLARAFLLTGSDAVIVSLWPVSDAATAQLMTFVYRGMREEHLPPGAALRAAQAKLRADGVHSAWRAPAFWAPFVCVGE